MIPWLYNTTDFNYAGGLSGSIIFSALNNDWLATKVGDFGVFEATFSVDDFTLAFKDGLTFEGDFVDFESEFAADLLDGESLERSGDFKGAEVADLRVFFEVSDGFEIFDFDALDADFLLVADISFLDFWAIFP